MYWFRNSLARTGSVRSNITHHNYDRVMRGKKECILLVTALHSRTGQKLDLPPNVHNYDDHKTISFHLVEVYH